jgi:RNA polymerase sigma-70 factor, ECF subfamily
VPDPAIRSERFVEEVIASQPRLFAYILTLLPDPHDASDVLQQTNMALWRDSGRFVEGTNFVAWALRTAYFKVLEHRQKSGRNRRRFSETMLENLARESQVYVGEQEDDRLAAMRQCLETLPARQREMLRRRYGQGESVRALAASQGQAASALATALFRIRRALWNCIQQRLSVEENQ